MPETPICPYSINSYHKDNATRVDVGITIAGVPLNISLVKMDDSSRLVMEVYHKNLLTNQMEKVTSESFSLFWKPLEEKVGRVLTASIPNKEPEFPRKKYHNSNNSRTSNTNSNPQGNTNRNPQGHTSNTNSNPQGTGANPQTSPQDQNSRRHYRRKFRKHGNRRKPKYQQKQ